MPTLAAGSNSGRPGRGFTLLETLVVLAILSLALTLVVPAVSRGLGTSLDDIARQLHTALRETRSQAVSSQRSLLFVLDVPGHAYQIGSQPQRSIPQEFALHVRTARQELHGGRAGIRFYPDGSATGGRVGVSQDDETIWLEIDWLTGRISRVEQ
ncbi:MAG: prepilin-type N-terminal cleavage/methylation domain-containing protein [Gammaproteobacteria bacterium]|nr:prepilin-type N-terminal cleavage/methylation domain-containing protein [Gammaproteobacteria bacterium]